MSGRPSKSTFVISPAERLAIAAFLVSEEKLLHKGKWKNTDICLNFIQFAMRISLYNARADATAHSLRHVQITDLVVFFHKRFPSSDIEGSFTN